MQHTTPRHQDPFGVRMRRKKSTAFCKSLPQFMLWSCKGYHSPWRCLSQETAFSCNKIVSSYILITLRYSKVKIGRNHQRGQKLAEQVAGTSSFDLLWLKDNYMVATENHTVSLFQYMLKGTRIQDIRQIIVQDSVAKIEMVPLQRSLQCPV